MSDSSTADNKDNPYAGSPDLPEKLPPEVREVKDTVMKMIALERDPIKLKQLLRVTHGVEGDSIEMQQLALTQADVDILKQDIKHVKYGIIGLGTLLSAICTRIGIEFVADWIQPFLRSIGL